MSNWTDDCRAEVEAAIASILNPVTAGADPLNPYRGDPDIEQVPLQLSIELLYNNAWYEQRLHVVPGSVRGKELANFEISTAQFELWDIYYPSRLTFTPGAYQGQKVRIRNASGTRYLFKGEVDNVRPTAIHVKENGADKRKLRVSCLGEMNLFRNIPIQEISTQATEGAMLADLCSRCVPELDASGINLAVGQPITSKTIDNLYLFELFKQVLAGNPDLAFFLDISQTPSKIYFDKRSSVELLLPVELTDDNIYNFCRPGDHWINTTAKSKRNRVRLFYPKLINTGLADVEKDSAVVLGNSNAAGWAGVVFPGMRFRLAGSQSSYTIDANYSTTAPIDDIRLSSPFREDDQTAAQYEITSIEPEVAFAEDVDDIERTKAISGRIGPNAGVVEVIINENTPLTDDEAQRLAEIALRSNAYEGELKTHSRLFDVPNLRAGRTLRHNMPLRGIIDNIPIQAIDWAVAEGYAPPRSGVDEAPIEYRISFTDRGLLTESVFLQLLLAYRRTRIADQAKLKIWKSVNERSVIHDCVRATEGIPINEPTQITDTWAATDISAIAGPWYAAPLGPGQQGFVPVDPNDPLTYNYAT